ncbi:MAG: CcdB family protein [Phenylobacterium sp.]|uniref:CcdB family protein n=1 Tax=Phenylobacterium sp. TaxID=1871053 RepID=UPI001A40E6F7|nr:CcdB family protein [Phenylobacterium sp.]MBL8770772.1 CcdB family protein [Phenylobacterium sp.]
MRQFDVVDNPSERSRAHAPYFVVLQSHHLHQLDSVVVAPVLRDAARTMSALDLEVDLLGERLVIALGEVFSLERAGLKGTRGSLAGHEDAIRRGLDRLFTGF